MKDVVFSDRIYRLNIPDGSAWLIEREKRRAKKLRRERRFSFSFNIKVFE